MMPEFQMGKCVENRTGRRSCVSADTAFAMFRTSTEFDKRVPNLPPSRRFPRNGGDEGQVKGVGPNGQTN